MTEFDIDIQGAAEVTRRLYAFSERLGDRVVLLAIRAGANYMLKKIREAEPVKTGRLRKATKVLTSKIHTRRRDGQVGVYIVVKKGKRTNPKTALYGRWLENGWIPGKQGTTTEARQRRQTEQAHRRIPGQHFVSHTFATTKDTAARIIINGIEQAGGDLVRRIGNL